MDLSKILPFQGMLNGEPWKELLNNPYWWYFEATVVSWSFFCGRFVAYCSNGYSIRQVIGYGTISLTILTVVWHIVSAATGYTLSFSRGPVIYVLTACTMLAFAITSLDSATKTLVNDMAGLLHNKPLVREKSISDKNFINIITYSVENFDSLCDNIDLICREKGYTNNYHREFSTQLAILLNRLLKSNLKTSMKLEKLRQIRYCKNAVIALQKQDNFNNLSKKRKVILILFKRRLYRTILMLSKLR